MSLPQPIQDLLEDIWYLVSAGASRTVMVLWVATLGMGGIVGQGIPPTSAPVKEHMYVLYAFGVTFLGALFSVKLEHMETALHDKTKAELAEHTARAAEGEATSYKPPPFRSAIIEFSDLLQASEVVFGRVECSSGWSVHVTFVGWRCAVRSGGVGVFRGTGIR